MYMHVIDLKHVHTKLKAFLVIFIAGIQFIELLQKQNVEELRLQNFLRANH